MTNLTEQWKKGELPDNHHYYYKLPNGTTEVGNTFCLELLHNCKDGDKIQILCEVPTYDDYERLNWYAGNGVEENAKLKELLKECRNKWVCYKPYDRDQLLKRIDKILANNQIQANTVACNKIQENE